MSNTGFDDKNVIGLFYSSYEEQFNKSWASMISLYNGSSDRAVEEYGILGGNPAMQEWLGARKEQVLNKKTYEIRNKLYEATLAVKTQELSRDKTGLLQVRMGTFAADAGAYHWETLLTDLMNANGTCYDGQAFWSTTHAWGDSGTQLNELGATEVPSSNVGTATAPTAVEAANILLETVGYMLGYKNDRGRVINGTARQFCICVSTPQMFSAFVQAIGNISLQVGGATTANPLLGLLQAGFKFEVIYNVNLSSWTDKVCVCRMDGPIKPFILQDEQGLEVNLLGRESDYYFNNKAIKLGVNASRGVGYGEPLMCARVTLT
jgi:phage major head subunit gpT-like protein